MNNSIAVIILAFNEEIHIERCIRSAQAVSDEIIVVDSFSTDNTCEIAGDEIGYTWKIVDNSLVIEDSWGEKEIYDYEIEGETLVIEGIVFTRQKGK